MIGRRALGDRARARARAWAPLAALVAVVCGVSGCATVVSPAAATLGDEVTRLAGAKGDRLAELARAEEAIGDDRAALAHWLTVAERRPHLRAWAALRLLGLTERTPIDAAALARVQAVPELAEVAERWALALQDRAALDLARDRLGTRLSWRRSGRLLRWPGTTTSGAVPLSRLSGPTDGAERRAPFTSVAGFIASPEEGPGLYAFALELPPGPHRLVVRTDAALRVFAGDRPVLAHEALEALLPEAVALDVELAPGEALQLHLVSRASVARARVFVDPPAADALAYAPSALNPTRWPLAAFELALAAADFARADELVDDVPATYRDEARAALALADPSRAPERAHAAAKALLAAALARDPRAVTARDRLVRLHLDDQELDAAAGLVAFEDFAARRPDVAALVDPARAAPALLRTPASCAARVVWLDAEAERLRASRDPLARFDEPLAPLPGACLDARFRSIDLLRESHALERAEAILAPLLALDPGPDRALALATGAVLAIARGAWDDAVARATAALALGGANTLARELLQRARRLAGGPAAARLDPQADLGLPLTAARPLIDADRKLGRARAPAGREILLDDRRVRVLADGGLLVRVHRIVRLNDVAAVEAIGELPVPDDAEVLLARTWKVGPRGLASLEPEDILEKATISLPDLAPGDYAEWAWFYPIAPSPRLAPGWRAPTAALDSDEGPVLRARYTLSLAPGAAPPVFVVDPRIAPPERSDAPDDRRWTFTAEQLPRVFDEPLDPRPETRRRTLVATSGTDRLALADALAAEIAFNLRSTPTLAALAADYLRAVADPSGDPEAQLMALYDRVRADIDEPDDATPFSGEASWVAERRRGSRVLLLTALCRELGLACEVVLARPLWEGPEPGWPDDGLTYSLVRWAPVGRPARWLDPTGRWMPYGLLPPALEGVFGVGLGVRGNRPALLETAAPDPARWGERNVKIAITVAANGATLSATGDETIDGVFGASWRTALNALTPEGRDKILASIVQQALPAAVVDEVHLAHLDGPEPLTWSWRAHAATTALEGEGGARSIVVALFPEGLTQDTVVLPERATPLLVNRAARTTLSATFVAPPDWTFSSAPSDQRLDFDLGRYERSSRYEDLGAKVVVDKRFLLRPGVLDPSRYPAWSDAAVAIDRFDLAQVVLTPRTTRRSP